MSGDDGVDVDWNTDDELEIFGETGMSSHPGTTYGTDAPVTIYGAEAVTDNGEASSSAGTSRFKLIDHFVGMGFAEKLVSRVLEENGRILHSKLICLRCHLTVNIKKDRRKCLSAGYNLVSNYSDFHAEEADTESILNTLLTYSTLEDSPEEKQLSTNSDPSSCDFNENLLNEFSDLEDGWLEDDLEVDNAEPISERHKMLLSLASTGSLSEKEKKLLDLANMGYGIEEATIAMERCGPEATVSVLTDFILAAQMAREDDCHLKDDLKVRLISNGSSKNKKRKYYEMCRKKEIVEEAIRLPNPMIGFGIPSMPSESIRRSIPESERGPPYFYYENVALAPKGVWDTISRFLYEIEPEFVDSKYFSACARKRGYVHNLPIENRFPLIPIPPLTIKQAFPLSKRWWPSWDSRDKLNCIQTAIASAKLTERIRSALERFEGVPSETVQKYVMEQCRKWNLVWVGRNKVAPLEPDEMEMLLGFPKNHTRGGGISRTDRYKSLGNSFQVDTVAYHLSVLKDLYPDGLNLLSLFSGIGGAEVALHRLGIKLKNVVSVEKSKVNRDIVRSWWEQTNQTGNLIDFDDVQQIDDERLEQLVDGVGGFDLIVGGSPCNNLAGSNRVSRDGLEGKESSLFFEYVRILNSVKEIMRARQA